MMRKKEERSRYHHGDLRAQIIETVRQLVEEKGADGFSITEASRRAGVSSAAPYKHFRDKPQIVQAVAIEGMIRLGERMRAGASAAPAEGHARIDAIGQAYIDFARAEPGIFRLMFGLTDHHDEDPAMMEAGEATFGILVAEVATYLGCAPDSDIVRDRAYMLWTFVHGHSFLEIDLKTGPAGPTLSEADYLGTVTGKVLG